MKRRDFLADVSRLAALAAIVPNDWRVVHRPRWASDPFTLGIASGDPTPNSVVLWTRLAPRPLDPHGGMTGVRTAVTWEVAEDDRFARIVKRGRATATPELSYSIHVNVDGLAADRWYFYRFTSMDASSVVGRVRTTPLNAPTPLRLGVVSCQHYESGYYTAYQHLAREEVDLVAHLGDYIYEYGPTPNRPRIHDGPEILTLDQYRARYALYKSDASLQAAHARCPWILTWDDHEVDNNYASSIGENVMESDEQMLARRAAGYQAWWEHQPVRVPRAKSWADLSIVRTLEWGTLAKFWMLDSRQYRSDQACNDGAQKVPCGEWAEPGRTMLGERQERWLEQGLATSRSRWEIIGNQTMVAHYDQLPGADVGASMDDWSGYPAARERLLGAIDRHARHRAVVLTGDNHANWVNELRVDATKPVVAAEFLGTSISSGGDGSDRLDYLPLSTVAENPHVKWHNNRRGYMMCDVTPDTWRTEFRCVSYVTRPGAPLETPTRWRLTHGRGAIERE